MGIHYGFYYGFYSVIQKGLMFLARYFQKEVWGKKQTWIETQWQVLQYKKYDEIDYRFGPSQLAELRAKMARQKGYSISHKIK